MSENSAVTSICERLHDLVLPDLCFPSKRAAPGSASSQSPQHHAALPARTTAARSVMNTIGPIAACLAGLLHVAIFYLEAIAFSQPKIYRRFLVADPNEAQTVKPWAFNQGFYNLFLAIGTLAGGQPLMRQRLAKDVTDETSRRKRTARVLTLTPAGDLLTRRLTLKPASPSRIAPPRPG